MTNPLGPSTGTFEAPHVSENKKKDAYIQQLEKYMDDLYEKQLYLKRRFFIPTIGTTIKLTEDVPVKIYIESRNISFLKKHFPEIRFYRESDTVPSCVHYEMVKLPRRSVEEKIYYCNLTLPKDLVLKVDRLYIRKNMSFFDSITFTLGPKQKINNVYWSGRFWLKRTDVNNLTVDILKE